MSTQLITSDLLEELSADQQELLSGGQGRSSSPGNDTDTSVDDGGEGEDVGFYTGTKRFRITTRSIVTIRRLPTGG
ncbi:hypothetical protein [Anabaena azotica]|uniref:Uncharacterized protein n=1 Tax=Anabaena azotica FACHB-119 TaxID=947527 RepID=A0ABR8D5B7_9NOST|nr:hypothetical protein [Anabaena azotica]MBD2502349.1 hypothetical protein [Anabaena azotica FACHB-119]